MKLRWSNGYSYAVEFPADEQSLAGNSATALEQFQRHLARRYHDGAAHQNMVQFPNAELHIEMNGKWLNPGVIKSTSGNDGQIDYFQTERCYARGGVKPDNETAIEAHFDSLRFWLLLKKQELIERINDTYRWDGMLHNIVLDVVDSLRGESSQ